MDEKNEVPKKKNRKKIIFWILAILFVLLLIPVIIAIWVCAVLFDEKPLPTVNKTPDFQQYESVIKKFKPGKNENTEEALMKDKTVALSKTEVNAVLDSLTAGARGYLAVKLPDTSISDIRFENGALHADVSQKSAFSTPFGKYMNMKITLIPRIEDKHMYLEVTNLSVGSIQLSGNWIQKYIDKDLQNFEKTDDGKLIISMLKGLQLEKDNVKVTFNPFQVQMFLMQKALSIFSEGGSDGGISDLLQLLK